MCVLYLIPIVCDVFKHPDLVYCSIQNFYVGPITVIGIGFLSALLGIGGGELMGPLFVILKFLPQVLHCTYKHAA